MFVIYEWIPRDKAWLCRNSPVYYLDFANVTPCNASRLMVPGTVED